jgi:hypothetical protein
MCLNETYSKVLIGKNLCDAFPIQNGPKKKMLYRHSFSALLYKMPSGRSKKTRED